MKIGQRKFLLACFFALAGTAALFFNKISGGEFIALITLVMGIYNTANYLIKKESKKNDIQK